MERIGKYQIVTQTHITKFSDIYVCRDPLLGDNVCIKLFKPKNTVLRSPLVTADEWRKRFEQEARILARMDHPHVVSIREYAETEGGVPYIVMPYYPATLKTEIGKDTDDPATHRRLPPKRRARAVPWRRATAIWRQVLDALAALHGAGFVHRDMKPGNVLLTAKRNGTVKICDFGTAKAPDPEPVSRGRWFGTQEYTAPEQKKDTASVDPRADLFSAGVMAYRMLSGKLPGDDPRPTGELVPAAPSDLTSLVDQCRAPDLADRPESAVRVLEEIERAVAPM